MVVLSNKSVLTTPSVNAPEVKIDEELALKWLKDGAKPTDTVHNILSKQGILKTFDEQNTLNN